MTAIYFFEYGSYSSSFDEEGKEPPEGDFISVPDLFLSFFTYFWYSLTATNAIAAEKRRI
jgi:hypothetical protein